MVFTETHWHPLSQNMSCIVTIYVHYCAKKIACYLKNIKLSFSLTLNLLKTVDNIYIYTRTNSRTMERMIVRASHVRSHWRMFNRPFTWSLARSYLTTLAVIVSQSQVDAMYQSLIIKHCLMIKMLSTFNARILSIKRCNFNA